MQTVSENWKNAHEQTILNESFVEISIDITDPDIIDRASSQDNGAIYISDSTQVVDRSDKNHVPYCTLEQNLWCLDGKRKVIPETDYNKSMYISDVVSDNNGLFTTRTPAINITFDNRRGEKLIPGITITWSSAYGEYADTFSVKACIGDYVIDEKEVVGNKSVKSYVYMNALMYYDKIEIVVKKWCLPNHRARIENIFVGINKVYSKSELFDYSHSQFVDVLSNSLPKSEVKFSVDNLDKEYDPFNNKGLSPYLTERQEIKTRYGLKLADDSIEWIKGGTFYLSEWYAKQNGMGADFVARDLFEFMSGTYHDDTTELTSRTFGEMAEAVLIDANLPKNEDGTPKWKIDDSLFDSTYGVQCIIPEDTHANCLQMIAHAAGCVLYQDRDGLVRIEPSECKVSVDLFAETDYSINSFNSYSRPEITLDKPITRVICKCYNYYFDYESNEIKSNINEIDIGISSNDGETLTIDNPLLTNTNKAQEIATSTINFLTKRKTLDFSWRVDPRLDALDVITSPNAFYKAKVIMTDVEFKFNGAFRGTGKGRVIV